MEDDLIFFENGRRPKKIWNGIVLKMEVDLNLFKMDDDLNFFENGRRPQFFWKWKTTSIFLKMDDDFIFFKMEDNLKKNNAT